MKQLSNNWITENRIDFEYKKYILLAYLQEVKNYFDENKLYPPLSEIVAHYDNLKKIKDSKSDFLFRLPKMLNSIDLTNAQLKYETQLESDLILSEIEAIIDFSLPQFLSYLEQGKDIFEFVEKEMNIEPIGLVPLQNKFGYLFIKDGANSDTRVYEYAISIIEQPNERVNTLKTNYIKTYNASISHTYNFIKTDILREFKVFSNPAVFAIETPLQFPFDETLLPVAKRLFLKKYQK